MSDARSTSESLHLRLAPGVKARLAKLARAEGLSVAQLVELWTAAHELPTSRTPPPWSAAAKAARLAP
jgi:hypothetical protein